jgi:hypothetical protein
MSFQEITSTGKFEKKASKKKSKTRWVTSTNRNSKKIEETANLLQPELRSPTAEEVHKI